LYNELKQGKIPLVIKEMYLNSFINHPSVLLFTIDVIPQKKIDRQSPIVCNKALIDQSGYTEDEIPELNLSFIEHLLHPFDFNHLLNGVNDILKNKSKSYTTMYRIKPKDKRYYKSIIFCSIIQEKPNEKGSLQVVNMAVPFNSALFAEAVRSESKNTLFASLSHRERDVAHLIAYGKTNKQISEELAISEETVKVHHKNIKHKLHAESSSELIQILLSRQLKK